MELHPSPCEKCAKANVLCMKRADGRRGCERCLSRKGGCSFISRKRAKLGEAKEVPEAKEAREPRETRGAAPVEDRQAARGEELRKIREGVERMEGHLEKIAGHLGSLAFVARERELRESAKAREPVANDEVAVVEAVPSEAAVPIAVDPSPFAGPSSFLIDL